MIFRQNEEESTAKMDMQALGIIVSVCGVCGFAYRWLEERRNVVARQNYDVFLAFRGLDTRNGFTDHLRKGLEAAKFAVFKDDCELLGEQIGPGLIQAIKNSKIAIPIISKRYAESSWCITELTLIMRLHAKQCLLVFPIFYEVDDFDVFHQTGDFGKAFSELAKHHKPEEVREWREALRSVTRIRGWTSQDVANGRQGQLVNMVVAKVRSELRRPWIERLPMFRKERRGSKCQVFLTVSPATEKGLAAHLYSGLVHKKIGVFSNDDPSLIGKDFAHEISNAIDQCEISIPIISKDYASSRCCLDNLAQMVECNTTNGQKILPIFFKVSPSQVQEVSDCFRKDMLQHKVQDVNTRKQWHRSLSMVGSFGGWVSEHIDKGNEGILVREVVKEVSALLKNPNARLPSPEYYVNPEQLDRVGPGGPPDGHGDDDHHH